LLLLTADNFLFGFGFRDNEGGIGIGDNESRSGFGERLSFGVGGRNHRRSLRLVSSPKSCIVGDSVRRVLLGGFFQECNVGGVRASDKSDHGALVVLFVESDLNVFDKLVLVGDGAGGDVVTGTISRVNLFSDASTIGNTLDDILEVLQVDVVLSDKDGAFGSGNDDDNLAGVFRESGAVPGNLDRVRSGVAMDKLLDEPLKFLALRNIEDERILDEGGELGDESSGESVRHLV
jgi:hypothetical protein